MGALVALTAFYFSGLAKPAARLDANLQYVPVLLLLVSILLRRLVLPRMRRSRPAFLVFLLGVASATASGFCGLLLAPRMGGPFFAFAVLSVTLYAPVFRPVFDQDDRAPAADVPTRRNRFRRP